MANLTKWYKRDPNAALEGMAKLTLEERGALITVLDLIYTHDGQIDDDDRFLAGWMRCDIRVWKRIRMRLIELGKLYVYTSYLRNERADREVDACKARIRQAMEAGLASAAKREEKSKLTNDLNSTSVGRASQPPTSTTTSTNLSSNVHRPGLGDQVRTYGVDDVQKQRPADVTRKEFEEKFEAKRARLEGDKSNSP